MYTNEVSEVAYMWWWANIYIYIYSDDTNDSFESYNGIADNAILDIRKSILHCLFPIDQSFANVSILFQKWIIILNVVLPSFPFRKNIVQVRPFINKSIRVYGSGINIWICGNHEVCRIGKYLAVNQHIHGQKPSPHLGFIYPNTTNDIHIRWFERECWWYSNRY